MDRLDRNVVHEICTNQVVVTLQACVKELVENALDAGATRIEVRLRENGSELLEVVDNGQGIDEQDYAKLAQRHATSKIRDYDDLSKTLQTFGFRGEALSAIAAMGETTVCTRTASDSTGSLLTYDRFGKLSSQATAAREVGTTVSVRDLFCRLPVRHKEFLRNAKAQVGATLKLIQSYAIAMPEIRFSVSAEKAKGQGAGGRAVLLCTSGVSHGWRQAAAAVLGDKTVADVEVLELKCPTTGWTVSGLISSPQGGRRSRDTQLYYVNRRPIDPPKRIAKLINDTYHQYNSRMWPVVILSFSAAQGLVDVNVTPDKRTVFLHNEEALLCDLQQGLTELYTTRGGQSASLLDFGIGSVSSRAPLRNSVDESTMAMQDVDNLVAGGTGSGQSSSAKAAPEVLPLMMSTSSRRVGAPREGTETLEKQTLPAALELDRSDDPDVETLPAYQPEVTELMPRSPVAWARPLQRRPSEAPSEPEFLITELMVSEGPQLVSVASFSSAGVIGDGIASAGEMDFDGFQLTEEYAPAQTLVSTSPFAGTDSQMDLEVDADLASQSMVLDYFEPGDETSLTQLDRAQIAGPVAVGCSAKTALSLAELGAAIERRERRRKRPSAAMVEQAPVSDLDADGIAHVEFPSAFSLASLRSREAGGIGASLEDVAKFATSGGAVSSSGSNRKGKSSLAESPDGSGLRFDKSWFSKMRVIGQFNLGFIIAAIRTRNCTEGSDADDPGGLQLFIIDQHASDEKFRFEGLNRDSRIDRQPLVSLHPLQLTPAQEQLVESHLEVFRLNGFEIRKDEARPPGRRLRVASLPTCQGLVFGEKDIHDLLFTLTEAEADQSLPSARDASQGAVSAGLLDLAGHRGLWSSTAVPRPPKVWQLLACRACRGAVMIGKALRVSEMEKILTNLGTLQQPWNCPHGRPTMRHLVNAGGARQAPKAKPPLAKLFQTWGTVA